MTLYVSNRARPPALASVAGLQADATLAEEALRHEAIAHVAGPKFPRMDRLESWVDP